MWGACFFGYVHVYEHEHVHVEKGVFSIWHSLPLTSVEQGGAP